jgi:hypothetical protein
LAGCICGLLECRIPAKVHFCTLDNIDRRRLLSVSAGKPKSPRSAATRVGVCDLGAGARGNRAARWLSAVVARVRLGGGLPV